MKRVALSDFPDMKSLSWALDQALFLLANSSYAFRGSDLCRIVGIRPTELTRMKLAHANPGYCRIVCRRLLYNLLRYLFEHYSGLSAWKMKDGRFVIRLAKTSSGKKIVHPPARDLPTIKLPKRGDPKPGSTRWFLTQAGLN
ncbi:MAG: hypothetical protein JNJ90_13720 [Saprospiraceae bacterium]|jgi:hypothetical protein|nr:hypothetical protein [Saprospiraceae bacterium]